MILRDKKCCTVSLHVIPRCWRRWRLVSALRQLQLQKFNESVTSNQICLWPVCLLQ